MTTFELIVEMLRVASSTPISVEDYHDIVQILRHYDTRRLSKEDEQGVLARVGWPPDYHPCDHMENIRRVCCFTGKADERCPAVAQLRREYFSLFPLESA